LSIDEKLTFDVLIMHHTTGAGGIKRMGQYLNKKQCVIAIKPNKDDSLDVLLEL
jgi:hypothetical protein